MRGHRITRFVNPIVDLRANKLLLKEKKGKSHPEAFSNELCKTQPQTTGSPDIP